MSDTRLSPTDGSGTAPPKSVEPLAGAIARRLADPFPAWLVRWLPKAKNPTERGTMPAVPYVEVGAVKDRLDEVLGVDGWETTVRPLEIGVLVCRLRCRIDVLWREKEAVGAASKDTPGEAFKAAEADALKRAAALFGVGRYLTFLPRVYLPWDKDRKQFTEFPELPAWALPGQTGRPATSAPNASRSAALYCELVRQFDAAATAAAYGVVRFAAQHADGLGKLTDRDTAQVLAADERAANRLKLSGGATR